MKLSAYIKLLQKIQKAIGDVPLLEYKFVIPSGSYSWWRLSRKIGKGENKMSPTEFNQIVKDGKL